MQSIWQSQTKVPVIPPRRHQMLPAQTDVLIIGGGMTGMLCAYKLQQAGIDYLLIEANTVGSGVTKNTTAKVTAQHGLVYDKLIRRFGIAKARLYLEANEKAVQEYKTICRQLSRGTEILQEQKNFVYATEDRDRLRRELYALNSLGHQAEWEASPDLPFKTVGAIRFPHQAQIQPLAFLAAICPALNICENTCAQEFVGHTVITNRGTITARKIIVATHFPFLNKHGSYFLKMYQQRSYVLAIKAAAGGNSANAKDNPFPQGMYIDAAENGISLRQTGELLLIGGGGHRTGKPGGAWAPLEAFAHQYYPQAEEAARWATQDCMTLDSIPYIGSYSASTQDLLVATGYNKWGMTSAMVAADILTDLVQEKPNLYAKVFSPSRSMMRPQLLKNAFQAVTGLITLQPRRCPHLGCALKWNAAEHTWDCPCHGSRFTSEGSRINGPATGPCKL